MTFKTGQREKLLKYFHDQTEHEYKPESLQFTGWKWTRHFLASKFNEGEWILEGKIIGYHGNENSRKSLINNVINRVLRGGTRTSCYVSSNDSIFSHWL